MKLQYLYVCSFLFLTGACTPSSTTIVNHQKDLDDNGKNDVFISVIYDNGVKQSECIRTNSLDGNTITHKIFSKEEKLLCVMNKNMSDDNWSFTFYYDDCIYLYKNKNSIIFFTQDNNPYYEFQMSENKIFILQQQGTITTNSYSITGFSNDKPFTQNVEEIYLDGNKLIEKNTLFNENTLIVFNIFLSDDTIAYRSAIFFKDNKIFIENELYINERIFFTETINPNINPFIIFRNNNNEIDRYVRIMKNGEIKFP